jgi:fructokinase
MAAPAAALANPSATPSAMPPAIGIDLGGTKTELIVLDAAGAERWRRRIATPAAQGYGAVLDALCGLVDQARTALALAPGDLASVGIGSPGTLTAQGLMKNANTQCLNGQPVLQDLQARLGQPVALANDANCLAWSEATDGAGAGAPVVFAAILGTGTGAGIAVHGRVLTGPNGLAGEWGHNPLPWAPPDEARPLCYCGQSGCVETLVSGPGLAADHQRHHGGTLTALQIAEAAAAGDAACTDTLARWHGRLARALAGVINLLDPDVIVLGGGLSRLAATYQRVPQLWGRWVFSGGQREAVRTRLLPALHGDASGVRGAAWLGREALHSR